jgi:AcrR family transcriptional regulator
MEEAEMKYLQEKLVITDAATQLYVEKNGSFTLHDVARRADITVSELFNYFSDKHEIIYFYYSSLIIRYRLMIDEIEDFNTFTLSEKLSNFAYTSFDLLKEREAFVENTFRAYILHSCKRTEYEREIETLFSDFFSRDSGKAASSELLVNDCSMRLIRKKYLYLINFWLNDESEDKEVTVELTDKVTGLIQEALYTSVADRSFDLAKFLFSNDVLSKQIPLWKKITSSFDLK